MLFTIVNEQTWIEKDIFGKVNKLFNRESWRKYVSKMSITINNVDLEN